jgi:hypothetical protein
VVVETASAVVAAVAAVGAVFYARDTVKLALKGGQDAREQHAEQIAELRAANEASAAQHRIEMEARISAAETRFNDRRMEQLQRVSDLVAEYVDAGLSEARDTPRARASDGPDPIKRSRLPALYSRLRTEIIALTMYGGIDLRDQLTQPTFDPRASANRAWKEGNTLLALIADIAERTSAEVLAAETHTD